MTITEEDIKSVDNIDVIKLTDNDEINKILIDAQHKIDQIKNIEPIKSDISLLNDIITNIDEKIKTNINNIYINDVYENLYESIDRINKILNINKNDEKIILVKYNNNISELKNFSNYIWKELPSMYLNRSWNSSKNIIEFIKSNRTDKIIIKSLYLYCNGCDHDLYSIRSKPNEKYEIINDGGIEKIRLIY